MKDTDMIIFSTTNGGKIVDAYSESYSAPTEDAQSDIQDESITVLDNGSYKFVCYRDLDTGDDKDHVFTLDQIENMIWAEYTRSSDISRMHTTYDWFDITLSSAGEAIVTETDESKITKKRGSSWLIHGIMMWTAWFLLGFVQIGSGRWFARYWKQATNIHAISGSIITGITLYFGIDAFMKIGTVENSLHNLAGFILTCAVIIISLTGSIALKIRQVKWNSTLVKRSRVVHKILGYIAFFTSTLVLSTGISKFATKFRDLENSEGIVYLIGHILIMLGIYVALEVNYRLLMSNKVKLKQDLPRMGIQEFQENIQKGQKLWIFNDSVLDLS